MTKRTLIMVCIGLMSLMAMGQSDSKTINTIKRDKSYIYEEATAKDADEAYQSARELLRLRIEEYIAEEKKLRKAEKIIVRDVENVTEEIKMQRGELTRVFLYVKKKNILPAEVNVSVMNNDNKATDGKTQEKGTDAETENAEAEAPQGDSAYKLPIAWQQDVIDRLLGCRTLAEARTLLGREKAEYRVKRYGTSATCADKTACFWITGDADGRLVTVLGPGSAERTNFRTLSKETGSIGSEAVIWFTLAK